METPKSTNKASRATLARIERKRETDRNAQRAKRAKQRAYIAHLEAQTQTLHSAAIEPDRSRLLQRLQEQLDDNKRLRDALQEVKTFIANILEPADQVVQSLPQNISAFQRPSNAPDSPAATVDTATTKLTSTEEIAAKYGLAPETLACAESSRDYFPVLNDAIVYFEQLGQSMPTPDAQVDEDVTIRVVLFGWDVASKHTQMDVGWDLLRLIDQSVFYRAGDVERVSILRMMRALFLTAREDRQLSDRQRPPPYMKPTKLQFTTPHSRLVDYFTWPSIRDYLILTGINFAPEWITSRFASDVEFDWPYTVRDACKHNPTTNLYSFSSEFEERYRELESWCLRSASSVLFPRQKASTLDTMTGEWYKDMQALSMSHMGRAENQRTPAADSAAGFERPFDFDVNGTNLWTEDAMLGLIPGSPD